MANRLQLRRDLQANWTSANPILAQGEPGLETDTLRIKYGDGITDWNTLSYYSANILTNDQIDAINGANAPDASNVFATIADVLGSESDPIFTASDAFGISSGDISDWNDAFSWGNHALAGYLTSTGITPAALTKTDDTNVTLTLGGTPATSLLEAVSLTLGWTGTLADSRIASASTWNAKQDALVSGTNIKTINGSSVLGSGDLVVAGGVSSVSGTTNRITSSGGSTPAIDISATFEALLGKVASSLSQFAATTSLQLKGVISDETGSGALVFADTPTLVTPVLGIATGTSLALGSTLDASAIADFTSTSKGALLPRMTTAQRIAISSPAEGLLVYDTSLKEFWAFRNSTWTGIANEEWIDYTSSSTIVGWSSFTTSSIRYQISHKRVYVQIFFDGISNSATTTFTLPVAVGANVISGQWAAEGFAINNGGNAHGFVLLTPSSNVFNCGFWSSATANTTTWATSNNKRFRIQFFYEID